MDTSHVIDWSREALRMALVLCGPPLAAALLAALVLGALQAITQMNEPIVAQIPRMGVILVVVLLVLPWGISVWVAYARALIGGLAGG